MRRRSLAAALLAAALLAPAASIAQSYPSKPLRMLVGFPPGGANDIVARLVAQKLGDDLGQPVVVENRPGNTGVIAAETVARSPRDGYTLFLGSTGTNSIAPSLMPKFPFDPNSDLAAVALVGVAPSCLAIHAGVPAQNVRELVALAKSRPGRLTYASSGNGTTLHLGGELFKLVAGVDLVHVPYKGNAQALNDVIGGQVDMIISALPPAMPLAKAGKLRILGVTTLERLASAPELPTVAEQGLPGFEIGTWYGVFAPGGSPPEAIERLAQSWRKSASDAKLREQFAAQGIDPASSTPAEFRAFVAAEIAKWARVIRAANIKAD